MFLVILKILYILLKLLLCKAEIFLNSEETVHTAHITTMYS